MDNKPILMERITRPIPANGNPEVEIIVPLPLASDYNKTLLTNEGRIPEWEKTPAAVYLRDGWNEKRIYYKFIGIEMR